MSNDTCDLDVLPSQAPEADEGDPRLRRAPTPDELYVRPCDLGPLFERAPLILGDNEAEYNHLMAAATQYVGPKTFMEAIWLKDVVDEIWEGQFFRRSKVTLVRQAQRDALRGYDDIKPGLIEKWFAGDATAGLAIQDALKKHNLDWERITTQALVINSTRWSS
jgi:hypothetical protein